MSTLALSSIPRTGPARRGRPSMQVGARAGVDNARIVRNLFWLWLSGAPLPMPPLPPSQIAELEGVPDSTVRGGIAAARDFRARAADDERED